ncbi:MAG: sulfite dehydrogenase (cytochrome) subunit SorB [Verrucomicrobia bacterium]|nr:sulfite dehydrogenase (cytochrome) subunit SorB [Verrucomicrobiota bacterium]
MRPQFLAFAMLAASPLPAQIAPTPEVAAGREAFKACLACHDSTQAQRTGPDLRNVVGRVSGQAPGFRFGRAMKKARLPWNEANLDRFLADPQAVVPGNLMPYPGLPDAAQRAHLIAYLKTLR